MYPGTACIERCIDCRVVLMSNRFYTNQEGPRCKSCHRSRLKQNTSPLQGAPDAAVPDFLGEVEEFLQDSVIQYRS